MPLIAVLNDKIITTGDIYKYDIDKTSEFTCFNCDKQLCFRQSRNGDNNYTEHFYHPNNIKDTHIDCEKNTLERIRDNDTWHNNLSGFIEEQHREIIRKNDNIKHIVDAYDSYNDMGIEFQNSHISVEDIQSRDAMTHLDWIFNVKDQYIRKVQIGNRVVCEIPHENWERAVKAVKNSVYLYTGYREWILLEDREAYHIEIDNKRRNVWIGKPCSFETIYNETILVNVLSEEGLVHFQNITKNLEEVRVIYARCKKSMFLIDDIHRKYVNTHKFQPNEVLAIKSVAGSGKTTTLLELAKIHNTKKILYIAFNKSLIEEIKKKIKNNKITNLLPFTFDALINDCYYRLNNKRPDLKILSAHTIQDINPWLKGKKYSLRKYCVDEYNRFCNNSSILNIESFTGRPLVHELWKKTLKGELLTFESLRKLSLIQKWFKKSIDSTYDMIMIDETQDFDIMMLNMLLNDTTIPKIFVGDPMQSIYQWRGCINGFNHLPSNALIIEFYSTFRIGDPACEIIRTKFKDCWMISKSTNKTILTDDVSTIDDERYTYLCRSWRHLLGLAQTMKDIWICNYENQCNKMRKLHDTLSKFHGNIDDEEFPDDLPKFLRSITKDRLDNILSTIEKNLTLNEADAKVKFYTIHAYKGLEDDNVRIANDNDDIGEEEGDNLYYVALTRGMKNIIEDPKVGNHNKPISCLETNIGTRTQGPRYFSQPIHWSYKTSFGTLWRWR